MKLDYTFEDILNNMLDKVPDNIDKREGGVIYDALAPVAIQLQHTYIDLQNVLAQSFANTSDRQYLILKAKEHGIEVFPATKSIIKGEFKNSENEYMEVDIGKRFSIEELNYVVIDRIEKGLYKLECEDVGEKSNPLVPIDMIPIEYISNLGSAKAIEIINRGEDEESTEHLRQRYFIKVREPATSGNVYHYKLWAMSINGVGGVKVFPLWAGNGTVKLAIVNSKMEVADTALINEVKKYIENVKPIGADVTVVSARNKNISITAKVRTVQGAVLQNIQDSFKLDIKEFFKENAFKSNYVSIAKVGNILLSTPNILDYSELKLNNTVSNIELSDEEIPLLSNVRLEVVQ